MSLRVLLVESEPEYALFLREVLVEIESGKYWSNWIHIEALSATSATEARAILVNESVDIIIMSPDLTDTRGVETFRRLQAIAPQTPIIVLAVPDEDCLA